MIKRILKQTFHWNRSGSGIDEIQGGADDDEEANLAAAATGRAVAEVATNGAVSKFMIRCRDRIKWARIVGYSRSSDIPFLIELGKNLKMCITNASYREELLNIGCIEAFRGMLTGNKDPLVHELSMICLAYLSTFPKYRPLLLERDLLDMILPNMGYSHVNLLVQTLHCVANLSIKKDVAYMIWSRGGLVSMMQLLCLSMTRSSLELKGECLSCMACMSRLEVIAKDLVVIGALVPIIDCLWLVEGVAYIDAPWHRAYDPPQPEASLVPVYKKIAIAACQCMKCITYYVEAKQLYFDLRAPYVLLSYALSNEEVLQGPASAAVNTFRLSLRDFKEQESNLLNNNYRNLKDEYQVGKSTDFECHVSTILIFCSVLTCLHHLLFILS